MVTFLNEGENIELHYHDKQTEKLCTDLKKAKKELNARVAEKLFAPINLLESAETLQDIAAMAPYHLHPMEGDRKGQHALDIAGRRAGYRLLIVPIDENGQPFEETDVNIVYRATKVIIVWEVTNHYE